ncbi:MAG: hypothetical protein IT285_13810 [Bdellovibrionales bacterium]|nr:hypothetical protein [Bdellovibrionales bacterium]
MLIRETRWTIAKPNKATQTKRIRERAKEERRQERQGEKQGRNAMRSEKRAERERLIEKGLDPDIAGIYPGPHHTPGLE